MLWIVLAASAMAHTAPASSCVPAGSHLRVEARADGFAPAAVTYTVDNRTREPIHWFCVTVASPLEIDTSGRMVAMPFDWRASIEPRAGETSVDVRWEASNEGAAIEPNARRAVKLIGKQRLKMRQGQPWIDFTAVKFEAGDNAGHCWSGVTTSREYPDSGLNGGITGAAVRVIPDHGAPHVLVEFPAGEVHFRVANHAFLVVPLALTWGVKGGFSVDGSIGIGLSVTPTKYLNLFANTNIGTALFNNVTHLRQAGVDLNIPIGHTQFAEGISRDSRFLTIGVEYFQRNVSKLAGFLDGPQWYVSGGGVAIRMGMKTVSWSTGP